MLLSPRGGPQLCIKIGFILTNFCVVACNLSIGQYYCKTNKPFLMNQIAEGHIFISNWICKVIWIFAFWPATFTKRKITSIKLLWNREKIYRCNCVELIKYWHYHAYLTTSPPQTDFWCLARLILISHNKLVRLSGLTIFSQCARSQLINMYGNVHGIMGSPEPN